MTLRDQLLLHEGLRLKPYRDTLGHWTIGAGRNLDAKGISRIEALIMLDNDIYEAKRDLFEALPWAEQLDEVRQRVLIDMTFNLGIGGLLKFKRMLAAVEAGDYATASLEMLNSRWAAQTGTRATRLARWMRTGELS